jgi:hypothetical protein
MHTSLAGSSIFRPSSKKYALRPRRSNIYKALAELPQKVCVRGFSFRTEPRSRTAHPRTVGLPKLHRFRRRLPPQISEPSRRTPLWITPPISMDWPPISMRCAPNKYAFAPNKYAINVEVHDLSIKFFENTRTLKRTQNTRPRLWTNASLEALCA